MDEMMDENYSWVIICQTEKITKNLIINRGNQFYLLFLIEIFYVLNSYKLFLCPFLWFFEMGQLLKNWKTF